MMTRLKIVAVLGALFAMVLNSSAVQGVQLSFQGSDVFLTWPSQPTQRFIVGYKANFDPGTQWTFLTTTLAASSGSQTIFTHAGAFQGGAGQMMAMVSSGSTESQVSTTLTAAQIEARRIANREAAQKALAQMIAQLEAAIAKAEAMLAKRKALSARKSTLTAEASESTLAVAQDSPEGVGLLNAAVQQQPAETGFYVVLEYNEDSDNDGIPNWGEIQIGGNSLAMDTDGDGILDGAEDSDGDGDNDLYEILAGSDPLAIDGGLAQPPLAGGVYSGDIAFSISGTPNIENSLGPLLDANGITAHSLVTSIPTPGVVRFQWDSVLIEEGFGLSSANGGGGGLPTVTGEEARLLHDAFGQGTGFREGNVATLSVPDQAKVDAIPKEILEKYEQIAQNQLRKNFTAIQEINSGVRPVPPAELQRALNTQMASVHTQFTRLRAITSSLTRRFGRAVNRVLPFVGGILILANANATAADFAAAMEDYARDISNGDEESGSAAIVSGVCNELAPGSGNIVLNYLLR